MNFTMLNENFNMMLAYLELGDETCGLKHNKKDPSTNYAAVNFLCQNLGDPTTEKYKQELRIPICNECSMALYDKDWVLVYCTYCNKSQWIYRPLAKNSHPPGNIIYWLDVCPFCAEIANSYTEKED